MKNRNKLLVIFILAAMIMFACQAITNSPSIVISEEPPQPTLTSVTEPVLIESPVVEEPVIEETPIQVVEPAAVQNHDINNNNILVDIYERSNPGVVAIQVLTETGDGLGSGFVIDKEGHIITNFHVIDGVSDLEVDFPSGYKVRGEVIGTDTDSDLAVVKVNAPAEELHPLPLGDSNEIKVGQTVVAIGSPFRFNGTMTTGIISSLGRTLTSLNEAPGGSFFTAGDIIQTDAAINPGNSGGPLLNLDGEVIGVNRAIETYNINSQDDPINSGIGFAIAINIVKRVVPSLISEGSYDYPYLGISSLNDISLLQQEALGLPQASGVYVTSVTPDSPADRAGIRGGTTSTEFFNLSSGGDLIIAIDGRTTQTFSDLLSYLMREKSPGDIITFTILRDNQEIEVDLILGKRP
ncbi:MAG: trypsin-like peptidase domain-containing protein [Chloroflexota bacterium]|nr:MAG: trypsin-like peptidase domain-containing protein [Chloroflexota bacterium]